MPLMGFRESNQVKWIGTRPAHRGTQVVGSGNAHNSTVILYTVPAGKTFFLCAADICVYLGVAGSEGHLYVRDDGDVLQYRIFKLYSPNLTSEANSLSFMPPLEIPAGWDICVLSSAVGIYVNAFIHGWVE